MSDIDIKKVHAYSFNNSEKQLLKGSQEEIIEGLRKVFTELETKEGTQTFSLLFIAYTKTHIVSD